MSAPEKAAGAFLTIGELAERIGRPQHILRYWETRFPQLRPLTRAGKRRYYRPEDVALVQRIDMLLAHEGYTIRGVQRLLASERSGKSAAPASDTKAADPPQSGRSRASVAELKTIRDSLADVLKRDG